MKSKMKKDSFLTIIREGERFYGESLNLLKGGSHSEEDDLELEEDNKNPCGIVFCLGKKKKPKPCKGLDQY